MFRSCWCVLPMIFMTIPFYAIAPFYSGQEDFPGCFADPRSILREDGRDIVFKNTEDLRFSQEAIKKVSILLDLDPNLGVSKEKLYKVCIFLERKIATKSQKRFYGKNETGFFCTIRKAPHQDGYILSDLPNGHIGHGVHKQVEKGVFYGKSVKLLAICDSDDTGKEEAAILAKLKKIRGIIPYFGSERSKSRITLYLEYFPGGSFIHQRDKGFHFTTEQNIKIMKDLSYGLQGMHQRGFIHRDLHLGNIVFRNRTDGQIDTALVDFGQTKLLEGLDRKRTTIQAARCKTGPEVLIQKRWTVWRRPADVYAMGTNFFQLLWNKEIPWFRAFNAFRIDSLSDSRRKQIFLSIKRRYLQLRKKCIGRLLHKNDKTPLEKIKILIFQMIHIDPTKRPTMDQVVKIFDEIAPQL